MNASAVSVAFRLDVPRAGLSVTVRVRSSGDRWIASADFDGEREIGLGRNPGQALEAALASLGQQVARALMADLQLLAPSVELVRQQRAAGE
jgi:hypothetical protein